MRASSPAAGPVKRVFIALGALLALVIATIGTSAQAPPPAQQPAAQPPPGAGRQGGGPQPTRFAGQTPINAMIVTGGPFHDYSGQSKILMDTLGAVMPINWTVVQGMTHTTDLTLPLYNNPDWAKGMDIVIHNECWADTDLPAPIVQNITRPAVPRMGRPCPGRPCDTRDQGWCT